MKLSVNWLLELIDFKGSVSDLKELLTHAGCSVESSKTYGVLLDKVVVAQILESERHPNADRLSVCQVADGTSQPRQIVCGANNYRVGDKVALALPGAVLPENLKIQTGKLRGVESQGMLCSAKELALAEDSPGLLILPKEAVVGASISSIFPADSILDLEITPNRADWVSYLGIAREVSAFTGESIKWNPPKISPTDVQPSLAHIEDTAACPLYSLRRIRGVQIAKSPLWLSSKLEAIGLPSINNVVDITNYVMFLLGQPLHAFDAARIQGGIVVRSAQKEEEFHGLDNQIYHLSKDDIVIADSEKVLALAGIIGGTDSAISPQTTDVLLESAGFDRVRIQRTSRRLGLSTDSSYRFERGTDLSMAFIASEIAAQLISELAGGEKDSSLIIAGKTHFYPTQIHLRLDKVNRVLGLNLNHTTICNALERIGLQPSPTESSTWEIPSFRGDLIREIDLIEEVARIIGIDKIPERKFAEPSPATKADAAAEFHSSIHQCLTAQGFFEARTSTLVSANIFRGFITEWEAIRLKNPLGEDQAFLRPALIPGLLAALKSNINHGQRTVCLYEIGKVFHQSMEEEAPNLGIVATGNSATSSWKNKEAHLFDFYDLKGVIQSVIAQPVSFVTTGEHVNPLSLPPGSLCFHVVTESGEILGLAGQLAPAQSRELGIQSPLLVAELSLNSLHILFLNKKNLAAVPRYPAIERDIAIILSKNIPYKNVSETLLSANEPLLHSITPFDVFSDPTGEKLLADCKSIAISLTFRSLDRTLTNEEVTAAQQRLKEHLVRHLGAAFRT